MATGASPPVAPPVHEAEIVLIPGDSEDEVVIDDKAAAADAATTAAAAVWPPSPSSTPPPGVSADEAASLALVRRLVAEELAAASAAVAAVDAAAAATKADGQSAPSAAAAGAATGMFPVAPWPDVAGTSFPPHTPPAGSTAGASAAVTPWPATAAGPTTSATTTAGASTPSAPPLHPSLPLLGDAAGGTATGSGAAAGTAAVPATVAAAAADATALVPTPAVAWWPPSPGQVDTSSDAALAALLAEAPPTPPPPRRGEKGWGEARGAAATGWADGLALHLSPCTGASSGGGNDRCSSGGGLAAGVFSPPSFLVRTPLPELPPHPPPPATPAARTAELAALYAQRAAYRLVPPHVPPFPSAPLPIPQLPPAWAAAADAPLTLTPCAVSAVLAIVRAADASTSGRSAGLPGSLHAATEADAWPSAAWSAGWDCGYRNAQTLLSAALRWPAAATALAAAGIMRVPSVRELQLRLEAAWSAGGAGGGIALGGDAWVGAVDVVALFRSLRLRAGVADFDSGRRRPRRGGGSGGPSLARLLGHRAGDVDAEVGTAAGKATATEMAEWAHAFFHQGHSRTVVGADRRRDGTVRLLVVDPSKPLPGGGGGAEGGVGGGWTSSGPGRGRGRGRSRGHLPAGVGAGVAVAAALSAAEARAVVGRVRLAAGERGLASPRYQLVWVEGAASRGGCVLEAAELPRAKQIADSRRGARCDDVPGLPTPAADGRRLPARSRLAAAETPPPRPLRPPPPPSPPPPPTAATLQSVLTSEWGDSVMAAPAPAAVAAAAAADSALPPYCMVAIPTTGFLTAAAAVATMVVAAAVVVVTAVVAAVATAVVAATVAARQSWGGYRPPLPPSLPSRLRLLDGLRAAAAIHVLVGTTAGGAGGATATWAAAHTTTFLLLAGTCAGLSVTSAGRRSPGHLLRDHADRAAYYGRRVGRLAPLYVVGVLAGGAIAVPSWTVAQWGVALSGTAAWAGDWTAGGMGWRWPPQAGGMPAPGFVGALALNIAATPVLVALLVAPRRRARTGGGAGAAAGTTVTSAAAGTAAAGAALWALTAAAAVPPAALPPLVRVFGWVPLRAGTPAYAAGVLLASALDGSFGSSAGAGGDRNGSGGGRGSPTVAVAAATILVTAFGVLAVVFGGVPPPLLAASSGAYFWARWAAGGGALLPLLAAAVSAAVVLERSLPPPRAATAVSVSGTLPPEWAGMPARAALAVAAVVGSPPALAVARSSYALYTLQVPLRAVLSRVACTAVPGVCVAAVGGTTAGGLGGGGGGGWMGGGGSGTALLGALAGWLPLLPAGDGGAPAATPVLPPWVAVPTVAAAATAVTAAVELPVVVAAAAAVAKRWRWRRRWRSPPPGVAPGGRYGATDQAVPGSAAAAATAVAATPGAAAAAAATVAPEGEGGLWRSWPPAARRAAYYIAMVGVLGGVWALARSRPAPPPIGGGAGGGWPPADAGALFCAFFPAALGPCGAAGGGGWGGAGGGGGGGGGGRSGDGWAWWATPLGRVVVAAAASTPAAVFVAVAQWSWVLCVPAMACNIIGHVLFPRLGERAARSSSSPPPKGGSFPVVGAGERGGAEGGTPTAAVAVGDGVDVAALPFRVYWRYVTRGDSPGLVAESVGHAVRVLAGVTAAAATENGRGTPPRSFPLSANVPSWWVVELVVPPAYAPPSGVRFKARALQYAILTSPAGAVDWVVHLDEETRFDALTVAAILRHCSAEHYRVHAARSARYGRIGQGPIVYAGAGRGVTNWLTTLADSYRVADDCGRFRLQYAVGEAWVGMHGSYVVAPAVVEADVTFDLGPAASITEDAYFALAARSHGVRFGWVDAPMYEQSPFGVGDFLKQRARWLVGLLLVCASPRLPLRVRAVLTPFTLLWAALPGVYGAMLVVALLRVASRGAVGHAAGAGGIGGGGGGVGVNAAAVAAAYAIPALAAMPVWCYLYGYFATFSPRRRGVVAFWVLAYLQVVLIPVFAALEASATVYALARFHRLSTCFHVVEKERPALTNLTLSRSGLRWVAASTLRVVGLIRDPALTTTYAVVMGMLLTRRRWPPACGAYAAA
ncbi:hypothetical protein MMPV_006242 [Pyropia vietnamensis]